jgi:hypothetical protein
MQMMSEFAPEMKNIVVVHPRTGRQLKAEFLKIKGALKEVLCP